MVEPFRAPGVRRLAAVLVLLAAGGPLVAKVDVPTFDPADPQASFTAMAEYLSRDGGRWRAANPNHDPENPRSPPEFGLRFDWDPGLAALDLEIVVHRPGTVASSTGRWAWHPGRGELTYRAVNRRGSVSEGTSSFPSARVFTTEATLFRPDGETSAHRDVNELIDGSLHRNESFSRSEDGEWVSQGVYEWRRTPAGEADSQPELPLRTTKLDLEVALDYENAKLEAVATMTLENFSDRPVWEVPLLLGRLLGFTGASTKDGDALELEQSLRAFDDWPELQVRHGTVRLDEPLPPGAATTFAIAYSGGLVPYTETGMLYVRDRVAEDFTILREDAYAFPVVGRPSWEVNRRAPREDFEYRVSVSVPEGLTVANGGRLVEKTVGEGVATWVYESDGPAPFLLVPIAEYAVLEDGGVRIYAFEEDAAAAARVLDRTIQAMGRLEEWLGPLGRPARLAVMEIPDGWGSQASLVAGVIQTASAFRDSERMSELYHEISHLWNVPDTERPSARWNEGLAVFLAHRLAEVLDGFEGMGEEVERSAGRLAPALANDGALRGVPFREYGTRRLTDSSYSTGFVMFYLLDRLMGSEDLYRALRSHYQEHRTTSGSFADLVGHLEEASAVELSTFLADWYKTPGWQERLKTTGSVAGMLESYRAQVAGGS